MFNNQDDKHLMKNGDFLLATLEILKIALEEMKLLDFFLKGPSYHPRAHSRRTLDFTEIFEKF